MFGISKDSVKSHENFITKKELGMPLLSDENGDVSERFDVWKEKSMYGKVLSGIGTIYLFIIIAIGQVVKEWRKVKVPGHVEEVYKAAEELFS